MDKHAEKTVIAIKKEIEAVMKFHFNCILQLDEMPQDPVNDILRRLNIKLRKIYHDLNCSRLNYTYKSHPGEINVFFVINHNLFLKTIAYQLVNDETIVITELVEFDKEMKTEDEVDKFICEQCGNDDFKVYHSIYFNDEVNAYCTTCGLRY